MKNRSEQILSFAENELIDKESIRRAVLSEKPERQKTPIAWTKILLPIAACFVLLCGTVLLIPSARAEVARWFRVERPEQYLTEDPEARNNDALESLILPPLTEIPEDSVVSAASEYGKQVRFAADEPIWKEIAEGFRIDLGETMYDGKQLYFAVTLHGLTALPEVDAYTGGSATQTYVPTDRIGEYFEDGKVPEEYTNGLMSFFEESMGQYFLRFADGTEINGGFVSALESNPDFMAALDRNYDEYGEDPLSDADREAISRDSIQWLSGSTLTGAVVCYTGDTIPVLENGETVMRDTRDFLMEHADENGILTAEVIYRAISTIPEETVHLEAELGTARFNIDAVNHLDKNALSAESASVTFGTLPVKLTYTEWIKTDYDDSTFSMINLPADLNGLTIAVENAGYIDALGVHGVKLLVTLPDGWTEQMQTAFLRNFDYEGEINGERYFFGSSKESIDQRVYRFTVEIKNIPYDSIDKIKTVRIIPSLQTRTEMRIGSDTRIVPKDNERLVEPDTNEEIHWTCDHTLFNDYTIVLERQN